MPIEQDIYNADGDLETQVIYGPYQDFNGTQFPGTITINRVIDEYKITLTVEKVTLNNRWPMTNLKPRCLQATRWRRCRRLPALKRP